MVGVLIVVITVLLVVVDDCVGTPLEVVTIKLVVELNMVLTVEYEVVEGTIVEVVDEVLVVVSEGHHTRLLQPVHIVSSLYPFP